MRCECVLCAKLLQCCCPNITCTYSRCHATSNKHFLQTSHCTLQTSHLSSFHLVSCFPICRLPFFLASFMLSEQFIWALLFVSTVERNLCQFFCMPQGVDHKIFKNIQVINAKRWYIVTCQGDLCIPRSTVSFSLRFTWSRFVATFRPLLGRKPGKLITLHDWLTVMTLHEEKKARCFHYPQWFCGPNLHLLATNDILLLRGKHSTTLPQRAHHHLFGQHSLVLPRYLAVLSKFW